MEEQPENYNEYDLPLSTPIETLSMALQWLNSIRGGNNFFGRLLSACHVVADDHLPYGSAAAVSLSPRGRYELIYSPLRFPQYSGPLRVAVLVHEAAHLALRHLERLMRARLTTGNDVKFRRYHEIMNVAADMAANDVAVRPLLRTSKKFQAVESHFIWPESRNYPLNKTFEEYFVLLCKDLKDSGFDPDAQQEDNASSCSSSASKTNPSSGASSSGSSESTDNPENNGQQTIAGTDRPGDKLDDSVPQWFKNLVNSKAYTELVFPQEYNDMTDAELERAADGARRNAKRIIKQALEQTEKCRGVVPAGMAATITDLFGEATIPWQELFRPMVRSAITSKLEESTAYPNLAWVNCPDIEPYPGMQKNFTFNILIGADTSGSVRDSEFKEFLQEILAIVQSEPGMNARLLMFDAALQSEDELTDSVIASIPTYGYTRYGYGGTSFTPFLRYVCRQDTENDWMADAKRPEKRMEYPVDLAIIFTDGYAPIASPSGPIPEYLPGCPLIWALTATGAEDALMQPRVIRIGET